MNQENINWHDIASNFLSSKNDEKAISDLIRIHLIFGHLEGLLGVAKIIRHRFEFSVNCGRIDLVLFHKDGGASLVEVKAGGELRSVVGGIGQLFLYEVSFREFMRKTKPLKYINKILVSPLSPEKSLPVMMACESAGVRYVHYATYKEISGQRANLEKLCEMENGA